MASNPDCPTYRYDLEMHRLTFWVHFLLYTKKPTTSTFRMQWGEGQSVLKDLAQHPAHSKWPFLLLFHTCCICLRALQFSVWAGEFEATTTQTIKYSVPGCKGLSHESPPQMTIYHHRACQSCGPTGPRELCSVLSWVQINCKLLSSGFFKGPSTLEECSVYHFSYNKRSQRNDP